jgi:hypothetical protein
MPMPHIRPKKGGNYRDENSRTAKEEDNRDENRKISDGLLYCVCIYSSFFPLFKCGMLHCRSSTIRLFMPYPATGSFEENLFFDTACGYFCDD